MCERLSIGKMCPRWGAVGTAWIACKRAGVWSGACVRIHCRQIRWYMSVHVAAVSPAGFTRCSALCVGIGLEPGDNVSKTVGRMSV